jgi:hypothetical protein
LKQELFVATLVMLRYLTRVASMRSFGRICNAS